MNMKADVLIVGGGTGGCAAALAAARCGLEVVLVEETSWIGGQFTAQGVPPDEHGWIERFGCTASYRRLRDDIRDYYRRYYPLTAAARATDWLNPGNGWVSPLCHEPKVAQTVLRGMLAPFVSAGRLRILDRSRCVALDVNGDWIRGATVEGESRSGTIEAHWFIDATELGDLLPMSRAEFVTGAESRGETGEPSAPLEAQPGNVQAFSWCFAMEHFAGKTIASRARPGTNIGAITFLFCLRHGPAGCSTGRRRIRAPCSPTTIASSRMASKRKPSRACGRTVGCSTAACLPRASSRAIGAW